MSTSSTNESLKQSIDLNLHSLASSLLNATPQQVEQILSSLTPAQALRLSRSWSFLARPEQRPPKFLPGTNTKWNNWLYLAGRGAGKTRSGAEWIRENVYEGAKHLALIAPTNADIRKVMVEGSSGLLSCCYDDDVDKFGKEMGRPDYEPSKSHRLTWKNGAVAHCFSAEEPDRLRGPQHEKIWADEVAAWQYAQETWDMAMFGLRLGDHPQVMVSTTPRPIPIIRELMRDPRTHVTRSNTYQNMANLAEAFIERVVKRYAGTRLGRQELEAELIEEMEGALWSRKIIEECYLGQRKLPDLKRIVVAIDPAITENPTSNLTGIVAAGLGYDNFGYVLADRSDRLSPSGWASKAIQLYDELKADCIVAEGNQGGDMVRHTIESVRKNVPIKIVHASRSKQARAEPVSALYEQGRVRHAQPFPEMEDQMCTWEPLSGDPSPDRLDAMVWAITELMLGSQVIPFVIPHVVSTPRNIPG